MNTQLTAGEKRILTLIIESDYQDGTGEEVIDHAVWSVAENNQDKGYMSSCVKKGLIGVDGTSKSGYENCWITKAGWEALKAN